MDVKILKDEGNELEIEIMDVTIAEVLRVYLHKNEDVEFAAWRKEYPSKSIILRVETKKGKTAKKAVQEAIEQIEKETDKLVEVVKKS
jgi:DNA-directed RNA polymerase subunit L